MNHDPNNGRTIAGILSDTKAELKQFLSTRLALFREELREKTGILKSAAPLAAVALVFLTTAYFLFTLALVGVVLVLMPGNPWRWCVAFLAIGILWAIVGGIAGMMAKRRLTWKALAPDRTINVLKGDGVWIQREVRQRS